MVKNLTHLIYKDKIPSLHFKLDTTTIHITHIDQTATQPIKAQTNPGDDWQSI